MFTLLIVLHVLFCIFLILVILLQTGKGAGIGAAFGGGSQTVFGPRGAGSFIGKLTGGVAAAFMITSIVLAYMSTSRSTGVEDRAKALTTEKAKSVENVDLGETPAPAKKPVEANPTPAPAAEAVGQTDGAEPGEATPLKAGETAEGAAPEGKVGAEESVKPSASDENAAASDDEAAARPVPPKKSVLKKAKKEPVSEPAASAEPKVAPESEDEDEKDAPAPKEETAPE